MCSHLIPSLFCSFFFLSFLFFLCLEHGGWESGSYLLVLLRISLILPFQSSGQTVLFFGF